jgi:predicted DNA-binding antitoxin AbrB/MazE fold protein
MVSIRAIYENGKLRLLDPVELQEAQEVKLIVLDTAPQPSGKRKLELFRREFWMSDDFDDPLPDSFWLDEDE